MNILRSTLLSTVTIIALTLTTVPLANAVEPIESAPRESISIPDFIPALSDIPTVIVAPDVPITFSKPVIVSEPAPEVIPDPPVIVPLVSTQVQPIVAPVKPIVPVQQVVAPPAPVSVPSMPSGVGGALVGSAYAQLGIAQDCTRMVENALGSIGIITGDIAPEHFYRYGSVVGDPQPGDLMIRPGHVAIYVGNGMAISGGFNGMNTVLHPASYLAGSTYVHVG